MRREFLCKHHRQHLTDDPTAALNLWIKAMENGQRFYDSDRYSDAVSMLGGAYEAAEILFQQHSISSTISVNHLTAASILLAKALSHDQQPNLCRVMLQSARSQIHQRMCQQTADCSFSTYGSLCISMLNHCYQELFNGQTKPLKLSTEAGNRTQNSTVTPLYPDHNPSRLH